MQTLNETQFASGLAVKDQVCRTILPPRRVVSKKQNDVLREVMDRTKRTILNYVYRLFPQELRRRYGRKRLFAAFLCLPEMAEFPPKHAKLVLDVIVKIAPSPTKRLNWLAQEMTKPQYKHADMYLTSLQKARQVIHRL